MAAISLSFIKNKFYFRSGLYLTIFVHLLINNYWLLSHTYFSPLYIFSSLMIFTGLAFLCTKQYEFVSITALNFIFIVAAYLNTAQPAISAASLGGLLVAFTITGYIIFIVRMVYRLKFKKAVDNLTKTNHSLVHSEQKLRDSRNQLHSLINSINDIVFEIDENRKTLNIWYNEKKQLHFDPNIFFDNRMADLVDKEKSRPLSNAIDFVINNHEATSVEFRSIFGINKWFSAKISPVYDRQSNYTGRISVAITDITSQKDYEQALQANQELLLEAQSIAKMANWWYDDTTAENYWSLNAYNILEVSTVPEGFSHQEYYLSLVHPDDIAATNYFLQHLGKDGYKTFEHKLITEKGNLKYIKIICGETIKYDDGRLKRISGVIQDITEIRLSEKSAKISRAELIEAQTIAKIGNWKFEFATSTFSWSDEIINIYNINHRERALKSFIRQFFKHIHPDDRQLLHKLLKTPSLAIGRSFEYRITVNGTIKHLSLIVGKVMRRDGTLRKIIGTLQDISERKKAELESERTRNKYRLVLEGVKLAALTVNDAGIVTFCNSHLAGILGYDADEIIGQNWVNNFVPEQFRPTLNGWLEHNNYETHYINPVICSDGTLAIVSWQNTTSFDEHGNLIEITSIGEDITSRQKATEELISAKEDAERSSKFQSDFLSTMSHEIRTPMNAVIGITNLLLVEEPKPEQMEYLHTLKFSGDNLLAIINDILDYNKIEAGKFNLIKQPVNLKQLTQNIWQSFLPRASQQGIELKLITDSLLPDQVMADPVRLSQILNNLISNSIKFTQQGSVTIKVDKSNNETENTANIHFSITDTGIGIAPESLPDIFDPFVQDMHHQNTFGGTGLGLAITKRLVNLHKGSIDVISALNTGTKFTIEIPFEVVPDNSLATQSTPAQALSHDLSDVHILVVDDNKMNLLIASKFLRKWRANVDEATNGEIAVKMTGEKTYSMIIMDLQMPVMDGFEATRLIKLNHPDVPVIALTADAMPDTYNKAFDAGMDDYLTKPFLPETLFEKVAKHRKPRV
ncbi:response regulator [Mucilaginibacter sp. UR6-1]|nr:response regulator [Mucilaginibacter sp. UR6-1]